MLKRVVGQLQDWFWALCRIVTRQECHEARMQVHETLRWVEAARSHRNVAERRFQDAVNQRW